MTKAKNIIYTLALCLLLSAIVFWFMFVYFTFDDAWFDYKTHGNFWLRTSLTDFFSVYWQRIASPSLYKLIYTDIVNAPVNLVIAVISSLTMALLLIYFGLTLINQKKLLILGSALWVFLLTISLHLLS